MAYIFSINSALADLDNDSEEISKAIDEYSTLIDIAVSDEPVYDYELRDSKRKLLSLLKNDDDKDRVVDIIGNLLESTHKYKNVERLGKPVTFTITYGCNFLSKLGTTAAFDRLLDEYEFWDYHSIKNSMYYLLLRTARDNDNFNIKRFTALQCGNIEDPRSCANKAEASKKPGKMGKGIVLDGGAKICC